MSGLPWSNFLPLQQDRLFEAIPGTLDPGGQFLTFAHVHGTWLPTARRFLRCLRRHFAEVETSPMVWRNLPPAIVLSCRMKARG